MAARRRGQLTSLLIAADTKPFAVTVAVAPRRQSPDRCDAMKLLHNGDTFCSDETLKRLLVVAKEIAFIDRPSVKLSDTSGTVGVQTIARNIEPLDPKTGIVISAHAPYNQAVPIFQEYLKCDTDKETQCLPVRSA